MYGQVTSRIISNAIESNNLLRRLAEDEKDPKQIIKAQKLILKNNKAIKQLKGES